jgi:nucleoside-diphosphate-sugar epimerase
MEKVLITGYNGFVGKNIAAYLRPLYSLMGLGRDIHKNGPVYPVINWQQLEKTLPENVEHVIHLAGKAHDLRTKIQMEEEYDSANFQYTKKIFDAFINSPASTFIFMSSVKAVADVVTGALTEDTHPEPQTAYGRSKLKAENYILAQPLPKNKYVYILRPCIIHGPDNKGNLNLLYKFVSKGIPYPLGAFQNKRSFLSINNLCFVIRELLNHTAPPGIYNVSDDTPLSTTELVDLINISLQTKSRIWKINQSLINLMAKIGDRLHAPFNSDRLKKLTADYVVKNTKLKNAIKKDLPENTKDGILKTLLSFKK